MSIALMTEVWRLDISPTDKMVLLALADAANDDGVTWMALESREEIKLDLIKKTSLSRRAVQGAIARLCAAGYLSRVDRPGKGVIWTVKGCISCTPQQVRPAARAPGGAAGAPKPSTNPQSSSEAKASPEDAGAKASKFDEFWEQYPSKVGKGAARKAHALAVQRLAKSGRDPHRVMLDGLARAKASARWADPTYTIPNPATWLNQERWDDEHGPSRAAQSPGISDPDLLARHHALMSRKPTNG